ncbi:MAG: SAM-dependent chlorinase/fluorinase [Candidatus Bathyarchaeota archaeon]|nr:SAM-dependent chlorinase/fluorinase [Candidatus Bathyarchaeota archaeon]
MITLTTDFGLTDTYVAQMKGVILTINPNATIIDNTHNVEKFNIRMGAFMLTSISPYFPKGTVHLAVVDPGVGTARRAIVIQTKHSFFVGPDNGILLLAAQNQGIEHIYEIANHEFMLPKVSDTFHGRDVFAPAAAYLDNGVNPHAFGPQINDAVIPRFATVAHKEGWLVGEVLHVDGFGNVITNIQTPEVIEKQYIDVKFCQTFIKPKIAKTYAQTPRHQAIALIGSHGFLEIALNQGNAAKKFHVKTGDKIEVKFV